MGYHIDQDQDSEEQIEALNIGSANEMPDVVKSGLEDKAYATLPGCSCGGLNDNRTPWCDVCQDQIDKIEAWCLSKGLGQDHYYEMLAKVFDRTADPLTAVQASVKVRELREFHALLGHKLPPWQERMIQYLQTQKPLSDSTLTLEKLTEAKRMLDERAGCFPVPEKERTPPLPPMTRQVVDEFTIVETVNVPEYMLDTTWPYGTFPISPDDAMMKAEDAKGLAEHGEKHYPWPDEIMPEPKPTEPTDHELPAETLSTIAKAFR